MAVRTIAGLKSVADSRFADNTTGLIEEVDHRNQHGDVADSCLNRTDDLLDEDDMASDSATKVPSQQSVKAYVDAQTGAALQSVTVPISSAEILALNTTPKVLIAAPGAGKFIQVLYGYIFLDFGGTAYSNETTEIEYATGRDIVGTITTFLNTGVDILRNIPNGGPVGGFSWTEYENSAVRYRATSADPTTGNGTISINLVYRIVTI